MKITSAVLLASLTLFLAAPAHAEGRERPLVACDQNENIGSVFYDFDAIYIYYVDFMRRADDVNNFPATLKYETFNARLVETIRKTFALCLKAADGTDKPIVVIPPAHMRMSAETMKHYQPNRVHNPKNLTLLVRGDYVPGAKGFGYILSFWYRPEVSYKDARLPLLNNSNITVLLPTDLGRLDNHLNSFFSQIRPMQAVDPRVWGAPDWAIESVKVLEGRE